MATKKKVDPNEAIAAAREKAAEQNRADEAEAFKNRQANQAAYEASVRSAAQQAVDRAKASE